MQRYDWCQVIFTYVKLFLNNERKTKLDFSQLRKYYCLEIYELINCQYFTRVYNELS